MPSPTYGTVTGTILYPNQTEDADTPASGAVYFTPEATPVVTEDMLVAPQRVRANLDETGSFSVELVATDTAGIDPEGFTYLVSFKVGASIPSFSMSVPGGTTTDLADVSPTTSYPSSGGGSGSAVSSVNGRTGAVTLAKSDVGLGNVDNTSDANKPVSTATATALAGKASTSHTHSQGDVTGLSTALSGKSDTGHSHAASDVTSGTLAVARIGSGTAAAGKYVDGGTGAWTTLPSGGAGATAPSPVFPLEGYGMVAASCHPDACNNTGASSGSWLVRIWVPAGQPITRVGTYRHSASGGAATGTANGFGVYDDDGNLLETTTNDLDMWNSTGYIRKALGTEIPAEADGRFVYCLYNVIGSTPSLVYQTGPQSPTLNETKRRSASSSSQSSWPSTINPASFGSSEGWIPLMFFENDE